MGGNKGNWKKMLFLRNEPTDLVQIKDLAILRGTKRTGFWCKTSPILAQKERKSPIFTAMMAILGPKDAYLQGHSSGLDEYKA